MKKILKKFKAMILTFMIGLQSLMVSAFAGVEEYSGHMQLDYGVEIPEKSLIERLLPILKVLFIPLIIVIGLVIYFVKSKSSVKIKILITLSVLLVMIVILVLYFMFSYGF